MLDKCFLARADLDWSSAPSDILSTPATLHPAAAASFADILQRRLRSVLFAVGFRRCYRGLGSFPQHLWHEYRFAQTFPLARRDHPAGAFRWLDADPRPGVDVDIQNMPLGDDPREIAPGWRLLEQAFGVARPTEPQQQQTARHDDDDVNKAGTARLRLYICPRIDWPSDSREEVRRLYGPPSTAALQRYPHLPPPAAWEAEQEGRPRAELARHLREEADDWLRDRTAVRDGMVRFFRYPEATPVMPRQGYTADAEEFERMERLPCTAVGMWLFPAEAFKEGAVVPRRQFCFGLAAAEEVRPGLLLFDVDEGEAGPGTGLGRCY